MNSAFNKARFSVVATLAVGVALLTGGCSSELDQSPSGPTPTSTQVMPDGTMVLNFDSIESAPTERASGEEAGLDSVDKRNCATIQYCNSGGRIICKERDCGCTLQQVTDECIRDARSVCGRTSPMSITACGQ